MNTFQGSYNYHCLFSEYFYTVSPKKKLCKFTPMFPFGIIHDFAPSKTLATTNLLFVYIS